MKRICFLLAAFCACQLASNAQRMNAMSEHDWEDLMHLSKHPNELSPNHFEHFPLYMIHGEPVLSIFGLKTSAWDRNQLEQEGAQVGSVTGDVVTIKVPLRLMAEVHWANYFRYLEIPAKVYPTLDRARHDVRADSVQMGWGLPQAFTGKDVIIGVTDWGFDYTHPMFYDTLQQETRVLAAWDQYRSAGDAPAGFNYGVEFEGASALLNALGDTANIYSYNTHGTHVAGIAGGGGAGTVYRGMAPEAEFLFATFLIDAASVIDAYHWMQDKATSVNKRLVINQSWGLYYMGTLDGNSLLSQAIDALSADGVVFCNSAGNNGDANFHIKKTFNQDTLLSRIVFDSYAGNPNMWGESITIWGEPGQSFDAGLSLYTSVNALIQAGPWWSSANAPSYFEDVFVVGTDTIYYNVTVDAAHPLNGRPHMRIRIKNTHGSIKVALKATASSGTIHAWNVVELVNGVGNWGLSFLTVGTQGVAGDANYSISEPSCTGSIISVAAYSASYTNSVGMQAGGQIAPFSSLGPLMTEARKPDIAAPGVNVASSISAWTDAAYSPVDYINFNGQQYDFARFSGTSMASPCVTGIVALMLDANPALSAQEVKDIIMLTAREDSYTGNIPDEGSLQWGHGKINAYAAVLLALATDVEEHQINSDFKLYPNPSSGLVHNNWRFDQMPCDVFAYDLAGKKQVLPCSASWQLQHWPSGIYVMEFRPRNGESSHWVRWVKE
ncbi:MAG: S8 family serine peptidase [Flavobacteriales bacterium]